MNYMSNGKVLIIRLIAGYNHSRNKVKVELDLPNYAIKSEVKKPTVVDKSEFAMSD